VSGNKVLRETAELKSSHAAGNEPQNTSILPPRSKQATEWNYISGNDEDAMRWSCSAGERDKSYCKIVVWKLLECGDYRNAKAIFRGRQKAGARMCGAVR
jgi:hypothetical protein